MKKLSVEGFARLVKIGTGAVVGAAAAVIFYHGSFASPKDTAVLASVSNELSVNRQIPASSFSESPGSPNSSAEYPEPEAALININTACFEELQTLPGIGGAKAAAIIAYREEHGVFVETSGIMNVSGIGEKIFEKIRGRITV